MTHPYYLAVLAPSAAATLLLLALTGLVLSRWRREHAAVRLARKLLDFHDDYLTGIRGTDGPHRIHLVDTTTAKGGDQ